MRLTWLTHCRPTSGEPAIEDHRLRLIDHFLRTGSNNGERRNDGKETWIQCHAFGAARSEPERGSAFDRRTLRPPGGWYRVSDPSPARDGFHSQYLPRGPVYCDRCRSRISATNRDGRSRQRRAPGYRARDRPRPSPDSVYLRTFPVASSQTAYPWLDESIVAGKPRTWANAGRGLGCEERLFRCTGIDSPLSMSVQRAVN